MKALLVLALVVLAVSAIPVEQQFSQFVQKYHKRYSGPEETQQRLAIFKENLAHIDELNKNAKGYAGLSFGVNEFADVSREEFKQQYLNAKFVMGAPGPVSHPTLRDPPDKWNWQDKGAVTEVKNQGSCGSCWSFSVTGNIEGQWFLNQGKLLSLSEQNLVDCDHECMMYQKQNSCDAGCGGGLMPNAYEYVRKNKGIATEKLYPYKGVDGTCQYRKEWASATVSGWTYVGCKGDEKPGDEDEQAAWLVEHGPISIGANAEEWQFYMGGVFWLPCLKSLDHGILIVGYGHEKIIDGKDMKYWLVKNSWGPGWGEKGYIKLERGNDKCGCSRFMTSAQI